MSRLVTLHGRVEEEPVPRLLVGLRQDEWTGLVELRELAGAASTIYLRRGLPVHVVRPDSLDRLDLVLIERGILTGAQVARAQLVRETRNILMGQALLLLGLVEEHQLAEALQWQLKRKVTRLFTPMSGTFDISSAEHPFGVNDTSPGAPVDTRALVLPGITSSYTEERLTAELGPLTGRLVRLRPVSSAQLNGLGFEYRHAPLLTHLRLAGFRLDEAWIRGSHGPRPREAKAILLALFYLDLLEFAETATLARVQPVPVLVAPPPGPTPARPPRVRSVTPLPSLDPLQLFTLAQQFFQKGDLVRAEEAFQTIVNATPQNLRARAFLTWIHFWKKSEADRAEAVEGTLRVLRDVLRAEETFAIAHYFVGVLLKARNEHPKAEQAFRAALSHEPQMFEAQRELRLMAMRKPHR